MERDDELMIAIIGLNYTIKDIEEQINGAEMCCMNDMQHTIDILTKIKNDYMMELAKTALEAFGL